MKKLIIGLLSLVLMLGMAGTALAYSFTDAQYVSDGTVGQLVVDVAEDGDWMVWTFDFPVEQFTGNGNLNVALIIATDGEGNGPAYQIHNNDGTDATYPWGTWLMSPWGPTISDGWFGWHSGDTNTPVTALDWVEAIGQRNTPWQGIVSGDGVMEIKIKKSVLGESFHWAASPTVGSGFWAPAYDVTMQIPVGFGWTTPTVDMAVPNYIFVPGPEKIGKVTGGLTLEGPHQQISFVAFDNGDSSFDKGKVEYQNFEYPGGLHYTTDVLCANVNTETKKSWFMFQIPDGFPGLSGKYVVSYLQDAATPGKKGDVYGHAATADLATAQGWCENGDASVTYYSVTGGNAVVHK